ncbi:MAG: DUF4383 domain-containing protein [Gemmatimonadaceae bacterium]
MTTTVQRVAMIFGVGFLLAAVAGFFATGFSNMDPDPATAPRALGLFPVNVLHNFVHLAFGIWGVLAARSFAGAKTYCVVSGGLYLLLVVLGFLFPRGFGLIPLGGNDVWLHVLLGVPLLYFGLTAADRARDRVAT